MKKINWIAKCLFGNWIVIDVDSNCLVNISGSERNCKLVAQAPEMIRQIELFCERVEKGEIKSKKTYADFKNIINKVYS